MRDSSGAEYVTNMLNWFADINGMVNPTSIEQET